MKNRWKIAVLCCVLLIGSLGIMLLVHSQGESDPLEKCAYSTYDVEENFSRQYYVVASYPIDVYEHMFFEGDFQVVGYIVDKKDKNDEYRTVYDSEEGITPTTQDLVSKNPYSNTIYLDMILQPLVDIYGDGVYRVINVGNSMSSEEELLLAHEYYVVSGEHLEKNDSFKDTFLIEEKDLKELSVRNGQVTYELTETERKEFIDFILNTKCVAVNEQQRSYIIACLKGDGYDFGWNYRINLNLPGHENCYIYNMTGKDLDGNAYQAIFVSGETAVCLNSEDNLLLMLDALKQKYNQSIQE